MNNERLLAVLSHRQFFIGGLLMLFMGAIGASFFKTLPGHAMLAVAFNAAIAFPAFFAWYLASGGKRFVISVISLSLFAYGIEILGVISGFPYDSFSYGSQLGPLLADLVPLALPLSWLPVLLGSYIWSERLFARHGAWVVHGFAALLMVTFDLILDPGAAVMGYWTWHNSGPYYGIPEQNYLGWMLSSALGQALLWYLLNRNGTRLKTMLWWGSYPLAWSFFFWGCIALFHGMIALSLWSACIIIFWLRDHKQSIS